MSSYFSRNVIIEGTKNVFNVGATICSFFEIGHQDTIDVWLLGDIVGQDEEFLFNGRLFMPGSEAHGTIIDNFPKGPIPEGWFVRPVVDREGYELVSSVSGIVLFGYHVRGETCYVTTNLYSRDGSLVAVAGLSDLIVQGVDLRLGRRGILVHGIKRAA